VSGGGRSVGQPSAVMASTRGTTSGSVHLPSDDACGRPAAAMSSVGRGQQLNAGLTQPVNTTVQLNTATVTPAFVLPGLGRGSVSARPPSQSAADFHLCYL